MSIIDIHLHGTERIDIKDVTNIEQIISLSESFKNKGLEGFLLALYPDDLEKMRAKLSVIREAIKFNNDGAKIYGAYLEGPFLNPLRAGALQRDKFLIPDLNAFQKLTEGFEDIIKIMTIAPELPGALRLIEKCVELGIIVSMGHSDATYKQANEGFQAGARLITHLFNAMRGIHHREPGIAGFGIMNEEVYIEIIGDGKHINDEVIKWIFRCKNPDKIILISDMVKGEDYGGIIRGGHLSLCEIINRLIKLGISKDKIEKASEENPRRLLNI